MIVTSLSSQIKDKDRVNVFIDGKYRFSLDVNQIIDLKIKVGCEYDEVELATLEKEGQFSKLYSRTLVYCLIRPHSKHEIKGYLYRKTISQKCRDGSIRSGVSSDLTSRVYERLCEKGYIDDRKFADYWVSNRFLSKGVSQRKMIAELRAKGIDDDYIQQSLQATSRNDMDEIQKIINKKRHHYSDERKLMNYLIRLGFRYDDIKQVLAITEIHS